jgi:hypothetical protein
MRLLRRISDAVHAFRFGHTRRDQERAWSRLWYVAARRSLQRGADPAFWAGETPPDVFAYVREDFSGLPPRYFTAKIDIDIWFARQKATRIKRWSEHVRSFTQRSDDTLEVPCVLEDQAKGQLRAQVEEQPALHRFGEETRTRAWNRHLESFLRSVFGDSIVAGAAPGSEASQGPGAGLSFFFVRAFHFGDSGIAPLMNRRNRGRHGVNLRELRRG